MERMLKHKVPYRKVSNLQIADKKIHSGSKASLFHSTSSEKILHLSLFEGLNKGLLISGDLYKYKALAHAPV